MNTRKSEATINADGVHNPGSNLGAPGTRQDDQSIRSHSSYHSSKEESTATKKIGEMPKIPVSTNNPGNTDANEPAEQNVEDITLTDVPNNQVDKPKKATETPASGEVRPEMDNRHTNESQLVWCMNNLMVSMSTMADNTSRQMTTLVDSMVQMNNKIGLNQAIIKPKSQDGIDIDSWVDQTENYTRNNRDQNEFSNFKNDFHQDKLCRILITQNQVPKRPADRPLLLFLASEFYRFLVENDLNCKRYAVKMLPACVKGKDMDLLIRDAVQNLCHIENTREFLIEFANELESEDFTFNVDNQQWKRKITNSETFRQWSLRLYEDLDLLHPKTRIPELIHLVLQVMAKHTKDSVAAPRIAEKKLEKSIFTKNELMGFARILDAIVKSSVNEPEIERCSALQQESKNVRYHPDIYAKPQFSAAVPDRAMCATCKKPHSGKNFEGKPYPVCFDCFKKSRDENRRFKPRFGNQNQNPRYNSKYRQPRSYQHDQPKYIKEVSAYDHFCDTEFENQNFEYEQYNQIDQYYEHSMDTPEGEEQFFETSAAQFISESEFDQNIHFVDQPKFEEELISISAASRMQPSKPTKRLSAQLQIKQYGDGYTVEHNTTAKSLIDGGAQGNTIGSRFLQLKGWKPHVLPCHYKVKDFMGNISLPEGQIRLQIVIGKITYTSWFTVVNKMEKFDIILGQGFLEEQGAAQAPCSDLCTDACCPYPW